MDASGFGGLETESCLERGSGRSGSERRSRAARSTGASATISRRCRPPRSSLRTRTLTDADSLGRALISQRRRVANGRTLSAQKQHELIILLILGSEV